MRQCVATAKRRGERRQPKGEQQRQQGAQPLPFDQHRQRRHLGQAHAQPQAGRREPPHSRRPMARNIHITPKNAMATDGTANSQ